MRHDPDAALRQAHRARLVAHLRGRGWVRYSELVRWAAEQGWKIGRVDNLLRTAVLLEEVVARAEEIGPLRQIEYRVPLRARARVPAMPPGVEVVEEPTRAPEPLQLGLWGGR